VFISSRFEIGDQNDVVTQLYALQTSSRSVAPVSANPNTNALPHCTFRCLLCPVVHQRTITLHVPMLAVSSSPLSRTATLHVPMLAVSCSPLSRSVTLLQCTAAVNTVLCSRIKKTPTFLHERTQLKAHSHTAEI
jgi:hypothetical protein